MPSQTRGRSNVLFNYLASLCTGIPLAPTSPPPFQVRDADLLVSLPLPSAPSALSFSPRDGRLLAVALDNNSVAIWDTTGREPLPKILPPHKGEVSSRSGVAGEGWEVSSRNRSCV